MKMSQAQGGEGGKGDLTGHGHKICLAEMDCSCSLSNWVSAALHVVQHECCLAVHGTLSPGVTSSLD